MTASSVRDALLAVRVPDELEAQRRTWAVVRGAYAEREPAPRHGRRLRLLVAFAVLAALVAAALSPPGRSVGGWIRDRVAGEEATEPALVRLPSAGRLLVVSEQGPWLVRPDGSKRPLGELRGRVLLPERALPRRHPGEAGRRARARRRRALDGHQADARGGCPLGADPGLPGRLPRGRDAPHRRRRRRGRPASRRKHCPGATGVATRRRPHGARLCLDRRARPRGRGRRRGALGRRPGRGARAARLVGRRGPAARRHRGPAPSGLHSPPASRPGPPSRRRRARTSSTRRSHRGRGRSPTRSTPRKPARARSFSQAGGFSREKVASRTSSSRRTGAGFSPAGPRPISFSSFGLPGVRRLVDRARYQARVRPGRHRRDVVPARGRVVLPLATSSGSQSLRPRRLRPRRRRPSSSRRWSCRLRPHRR